MNGKTLKALLCAFVLLAAAVLGSCSTGSAQSVAPLIDFIGSGESLAAGDYVTFGHYEQDNDLSNGAELIEWRVVSAQKEMGKVVLLSRYGLDAQPMHHDWGFFTHWKDCYLCIWLNDKFYNTAFSPEEQSAIIPLFVDSNSGSYCPKEYSGEYTDDLVSIFLPSSRQGRTAPAAFLISPPPIRPMPRPRARPPIRGTPNGGCARMRVTAPAICSSTTIQSRATS